MTGIVAGAAIRPLRGTTAGTAYRSEELSGADQLTRWIERAAFEIELFDRFQRLASLEASDRKVACTGLGIRRSRRPAGQAAVDRIADPSPGCIDRHAAQSHTLDESIVRETIDADERFAGVA